MEEENMGDGINEEGIMEGMEEGDLIGLSEDDIDDREEENAAIM
jgi:hypothetical protein